MFVGMISLSNFGRKQVILGFLDIELQLCDNLSCIHFSSGFRSRGWGERWDNTRGSPSLQVEGGETCGGINCVHNGEADSGKLGKPTLLVVVDMVTDGLVEGFVCAFTCAVRLGVISC